MAQRKTLIALDDLWRVYPGPEARIVTAEKASAITVPLSAVVTGGRSEHGMVERVAQVTASGVVR